MPLDTGAVTQNLLMSAGVDMGEASDPSETAIEGALSIGAALRATRQRLGRSLQDVSDATRIKRAYLEALEEMRLEDLPSRPFTIGYVRSYARTLGLDADAAVERFKLDVPMEAEPLRAPVGVRKHSDVRIALLAGGGAIVVSAVLLWNLAQHAVSDQAAAPAVVPESAAPAPAAASAAPATVAISAPQPAPQESTLPQPYLTPGLDGASASPAAAGDGAIDPKAPQVFAAHGAVYGAAAAVSNITLQANKSVSVVIRTADGKVVFAQELKAGEAYRAPPIDGISADVSNPQDINVYVGGRIHAGLTAPVMPLAKLADLRPPPPAPPAAPGPVSAAPGAAAATAAASAKAGDAKSAAPKGSGAAQAATRKAPPVKALSAKPSPAKAPPSDAPADAGADTAG
jgi:transcriptional regulator with XRE-family HTH domain